jgi:electron transport complex protein RnfD
MTSWPVNKLSEIDATTSATPLSLIKEGITNGTPISQIEGLPNMGDMMLGIGGGSLGEISALLIILGGFYLIWKKVITWHIPMSIIVTVIFISGIFWIINPRVGVYNIV